MGTYTIRKLVYFSRKPVMDRHTYIHTYKHNLRIRPHKRPPRLHDYVPHAKAFGNELKYKSVPNFELEYKVKADWYLIMSRNMCL